MPALRNIRYRTIRAHAVCILCQRAPADLGVAPAATEPLRHEFVEDAGWPLFCRLCAATYTGDLHGTVVDIIQWAVSAARQMP